MSKITPQDYIDASHHLERAGFLAIKTLLADDADGVKPMPDIATLYGIDIKSIEIVKTTGSYSEYSTIKRLETEREALEVELEDVKTKEAKVKPKKWHYVVASVILVALGGLVVWGVLLLTRWLTGLS